MIKSKCFGDIALVADTTIGSGMLVLPVSTASVSFLPSILCMVLVCSIMYQSALLMSEARLRLPASTNIISMAAIYFDLPGRIFAWTVYLLLLYVLMMAYLSGLSDMLVNLCTQLGYFSHYNTVVFFIACCIGTILLWGLQALS